MISNRSNVLAVTGLAAIGTLILCLPAIAADKATSQGTLRMGDRSYKLTHFVAYPTKRDDGESIALVASDRSIPLKAIQKTLRENDGADDQLSLDQTNLHITCNAEGKPQHCQAKAGSGYFSIFGDDVQGTLKVEGNRAVGKLTMAEKGEGALKRSFELEIDCPFGIDAAPVPAKPTGAVKPSVTGTFTGNGKPAKLAFISARRGEPFDDKPSIVLVMTERDHSRDKKPETGAAFGKYGSALIISTTEEGSIFGCEVAHASHSKKPFSSIGSISMGDFDLGEQYVRGALTTDGEQDVFGEKWAVDLNFAAPLPAAAKSTAAAPSAAPTKKPGGTATPARKPQPSAPPVATLNVHELALPKDLTDVEYKAIVEQFVFKSPAKVQALAGDLTKRLATQGWSKEDSDLVTPKSAILRRKRGEATLTIMLKPADTGSQGTVFATGLDWEEK